jgi:tripartite-type tricarboxylate transporter receptor subunit TctC
MEYVAHAKPDGYTLGWPAGDAITMVPAFKKQMPYRVPEDFTFIAKLVETGLSLAVRKDLPAKTVPEFVAYAKAHPDQVKFGTSGVASGADIVTYLFAKATDTKVVHIPYKGMDPAVGDLLGGHIDVIFATPSVVQPLEKAGNIRILAVTSEKRVPLLPDVPTVKGSRSAEHDVLKLVRDGRAGETPAEIVERLRKEMAAIAEEPEVREKLAKAALDVAPTYTTRFEEQVIKDLKTLKALGASEHIIIE